MNVMIVRIIRYADIYRDGQCCQVIINQSDIIIIPPRRRTSSRVDVGREEFQNLPSERRALMKSRKPHELPLCVGRGLVAYLFADPSA